MTAPEPGQAACEVSAAPEDAALCMLASKWEREAFKMPRLLGEQDPRAEVLRDCGDQLRALVVKLFRHPGHGDLSPFQDRHADLDAGEFGGAMTDAEFYDRLDDGSGPSGQLHEGDWDDAVSEATS